MNENQKSDQQLKLEACMKTTKSDEFEFSTTNIFYWRKMLKRRISFEWMILIWLDNTPQTFIVTSFTTLKLFKPIV